MEAYTEGLPLMSQPLHQRVIDPDGMIDTVPAVGTTGGISCAIGGTASTRLATVALAPAAHDAAGPRPTPRHIARRALLRDGRIALAPAAASAAVIVLEPERPLHCGLLAAIAFTGAALLANRSAGEAARLPLMRSLYPLVAPLLGLAGLLALTLAAGNDTPHPLALAGALLAGTAAGALADRLLARGAPATLRVALIGGAHAAGPLALALTRGSRGRYALVGSILTAGDDDPPGAVPALGRLDELARLVVEHRIDVLVLAADAPRLEVFEHVTHSCLELPVRLAELPELYEEVFGYVPTASIDAAWFACLAHPRVREPVGVPKRALDVVVAAAVGLLALPLLAILALLIRRDGGPALFSQLRIGEGGRPFRVYKLRSMTPSAGTGAQWAQLDDPRITPIGRFLRASHLDELPQLYNVLRGEMTLVGPRPEQPEFVERLEGTLPFYQRRHTMRPGITGWAQIRCGYAGSDVGSAWKLCHDLYYAKHRSLGLDLLILCETLATLVLPREPVIQPENAAFIVGHPNYVS